MQPYGAAWCQARNNERAKTLADLLVPRTWHGSTGRVLTDLLVARTRTFNRSRSRSRGEEPIQLVIEQQERLKIAHRLEQFEPDALSVEPFMSAEHDFEREQQGTSSSSVQEITATSASFMQVQDWLIQSDVGQEQQGTSEQQDDFEQEQKQDEEQGQGQKRDEELNPYQREHIEETPSSDQESTATENQQETSSSRNSSRELEKNEMELLKQKFSEFAASWGQEITAT